MKKVIVLGLIVMFIMSLGGMALAKNYKALISPGNYKALIHPGVTAISQAYKYQKAQKQAASAYYEEYRNLVTAHHQEIAALYNKQVKNLGGASSTIATVINKLESNKKNLLAQTNPFIVEGRGPLVKKIDAYVKGLKEAIKIVNAAVSLSKQPIPYPPFGWPGPNKPVLDSKVFLINPKDPLGIFTCGGTLADKLNWLYLGVLGAIPIIY